MRKTAHSAEHERIVAEALSPVATELRMIDAADLVSLLRYERWGNISDLVSSAAELYFLPGTVNFGTGGEYRLDWDSKPEILLDLEIKPEGVTIYAKLSLADVQAGLEIDHIAFHGTPDLANETEFLARTLSASKFITKPDSVQAAPQGH
jgi:hypothetical protein